MPVTVAVPTCGDDIVACAATIYISGHQRIENAADAALALKEFRSSSLPDVSRPGIATRLLVSVKAPATTKSPSTGSIGGSTVARRSPNEAALKALIVEAVRLNTAKSGQLRLAVLPGRRNRRRFNRRGPCH